MPEYENLPSDWKVPVVGLGPLAVAPDPIFMNLAETRHQMREGLDVIRGELEQLRAAQEAAAARAALTAEVDDRRALVALVVTIAGVVVATLSLIHAIRRGRR